MRISIEILKQSIIIIRFGENYLDMKVVLNLAWTLLLLVFGFGIGAFYVIGKSNSTFYRFESYQEEFILAGIGFVIFSICIGLITLLISKLLKSNNKIKITLIVVTMVTVIFGIQSYFMVDDVELIKERAIIWGDNEEKLIAEINNDLLEEGHDSNKSVDFAECIIDNIKYNDYFFYTLTEKENMFLFLINSKEYNKFKEQCVNKKEITQAEKEAFEQEMRELLGY